MHAGVCGEECPTGCRASEGSFSQRVMWRQGGDLEAYMYTPDRDEECGDSWQWDVTAGDTFREVRVYNKMNDAGASPHVSLLGVQLSAKVACHAKLAPELAALQPLHAGMCPIIPYPPMQK